MLRMPEFEYHHPKSAEEAVALWNSLPDAMYVAGGTDLLPNMKHKQKRQRSPCRKHVPLQRDTRGKYLH